MYIVTTTITTTVGSGSVLALGLWNLRLGLGSGLETPRVRSAWVRKGRGTKWLEAKVVTGDERKRRFQQMKVERFKAIWES